MDIFSERDANAGDDVSKKKAVVAWCINHPRRGLLPATTRTEVGVAIRSYLTAQWRGKVTWPEAVSKGFAAIRVRITEETP